MAGITSSGFESKDLDTILAEIEADEKNSLGQDLNVRPTSVFGVVNGIVASKLTELWDVSNDVWASQNPDTAVGTSLDQLCQLTGVTRLKARSSTVTLSLTGTNGTSIPALRRVKHSGTGTYWTNALSGTIGPTGVLIDFQSEDTGPIAALAATLTIIDTPVAGWTSVSNPLDALPGRDVETDAELRLRRSQLLTAQGKGTVDAIRADLIAIEDVTEAIVYENYGSVTDADGVPSKAFEAVVEGGNVSLIAQAIWDSKPVGISAYGTSSASAVDGLGGTRIVGYTRPVAKNVYVSITAATSTGWSGLTADIAVGLKSYGDTLAISEDVVRSKLYAPVTVLAGIDDVTNIKLGFTASPTGTANLAVGTREHAKFDTSRVVVTLV